LSALHSRHALRQRYKTDWCNGPDSWHTLPK